MTLDIAVAIIGGLTCVTLIVAALFASRLISFRVRSNHTPNNTAERSHGETDE